MSEYRAIKLSKGSGGWGGPLVIKPEGDRNIILNITGGGIKQISYDIAEACGGEAFDGFKGAVDESRVLCAVVDCGGVARCGVYPKKRIPTVNLTPIGPSGPLAQFITEDIYVSGNVKVEIVGDNEETIKFESSAKPSAKKEEHAEAEKKEEEKTGGVMNVITKIGQAVGGVVNKIFAAAKDSVNTVITNVLPFMVFIGLICGAISYTGVGTWIANTISPLIATLPGMLVVCIVCALPFVSPLIGPGAVIAQIVGVLIGQQIGMGAIPASYALPALFAIDPQVGCDFIPVGLSLGEADPATVETGVPAILFSRLITGPIAVILAFIVSMVVGLYK